MKNGFRIRDLFPHSKKKVKIKVETKKTLQIRRLTKSIKQFCPICQKPGLFITGKEALCLIGGDIKTFENLLERGSLHLVKSSGDENRICINSLMWEMENDREMD